MSEKDLVYRSNPNSQPNNMAVAYISKSYKPVPVAVTYTVNAGATSIALTATLPANNTVAFLRMTVTDAKGNEAVGQFDAANIAGGATVDVSGLDKTTDWLCQLAWAEPTISQESPKFDSIEFVLEGAKGSVAATLSTAELTGTMSADTEAVVAGVVTVAKATTADTGTLAFGNVAQNAVAYALIYFNNTATGQKPLRVLSVVDNGAAMTVSTSFSDSPYLPLAVAAGEESVSTLKVALDTTVLGAIAASSITITTNDSANPVYVINFTATIV